MHLYKSLNNSKKGEFFLFTEVLGIFPSKERFTNVLMSTLKGIPTVLCSKAIPMDGSGSDHDSEDTETSPPKSEAAKSTAELR